MKLCCKQYLDEQFGGDADMVNEIYAEYASSMKDKAQDAVVALAGASWEILDRVAHTIKGNALAAGDNDMAHLGIELRQAAKLQDSSLASSLIEGIKAMAQEL